MQQSTIVPEVRESISLNRITTHGDIHEPTDAELIGIEAEIDFSGTQALANDFMDLCQYSEEEASAAVEQVLLEDEKF